MFKAVNLTLFVKMFLLLFLSVSVPVTILGYLYYNQSEQQIKQVTSALLMENLQQNRQRLERYFRDVELHTETVIGSRKMEMLIDPETGRSLEDRLFLGRSLALAAEIKGRYQMDIYPPDASRYAAYSALRHPDSVPENTDWVLAAVELEGSGFWYYENGAFIFARMIRDMADLQPLSVIRIVIPTSDLEGQFMSPSNYPNLEHYITDAENHTVLISRDNESPFGKQNVLIADMPLNESPWRLVAVIPESDLLGPVEKIKRFSFVLVLLSLALISMLLAFITNSFVSPIKVLVGQMKKVQLGKLVPSDHYAERRDEVGQLTRGYNSLIFGMQELLASTKRMESDKSRMEMQMLIHQINPHFLYNTLDAMKWRAEYVQEHTISEMVTSLGNLIRYSINNGEEFTTVEREVEHARSYLNIEALRNSGSFQVFFHVQPRLSNYTILKLIIQPLVENSVRHGLNKLPYGQGKLLVRIFLEGDHLVCTVEDNGPGLSKDARERLGQEPARQGEAGGVGLYNVNQRLNIRFGKEYGVVLANREAGGCLTTIRHPVLETLQEE